MAAIAVGLDEVTSESYLQYRIATVKYVTDRLMAAGVPVLLPPGGHAVYLDAAAMLPDVPRDQFPGHAVACALYLEGGVRACEIGSLMFGRDEEAHAVVSDAPRRELVRLAFPRRMYTQAHMDYAIEVCIRVHEMCKMGDVAGYRITEGASNALRHFSAVLEPMSASGVTRSRNAGHGRPAAHSAVHRRARATTKGGAEVHDQQHRHQAHHLQTRHSMGASPSAPAAAAASAA